MRSAVEGRSRSRSPPRPRPSLSQHRTGSEEGWHSPSPVRLPLCSSLHPPPRAGLQHALRRGRRASLGARGGGGGTSTSSSCGSPLPSPSISWMHTARIFSLTTSCLNSSAISRMLPIVRILAARASPSRSSSGESLSACVGAPRTRVSAPPGSAERSWAPWRSRAGGTGGPCPGQPRRLHGARHGNACAACRRQAPAAHTRPRRRRQGHGWRRRAGRRCAGGCGGYGGERVAARGTTGAPGAAPRAAPWRPRTPPGTC